MKKLFAALFAAALILRFSTGALAADDAGLVTDAYTYVSENSDEYHVPAIHREGPGVMALNKIMEEELYDTYVAPAQYAAEYGDEYYSTGFIGLSYDWAVNGDVLSILAVAHGITDNDEYHVYNMSLSEGERISDAELLKAAGVTREEFNALARTAVSASFDEYAGFGDEDFVETQRSRSVTDENIALARPYMGAGGSLCAVTWQYAIAGAERYLRSFTLIPGDMQTRLEEFMEHSDERYFSREDIDGFDQQACLYARNSIFAQLGWKFDDAELRAYFSQFDWYTPTLDPAQFTEDMLNDCQQANVALVQAYEQEQGY